MWATMDVKGVDIAPERNDHSPNSIFLISWMVIGCFVALNLFVGAIVDNFTRIKHESDGSATMTAGQQQWVQAMSGAMRSKAMRTIKKPTAWVRRQLARQEYGQQPVRLVDGAGLPPELRRESAAIVRPGTGTAVV